MNRKQRRQRDWLGKRIAELATGPRTEDAMAELRACAAELEAMRDVPESPALPPGDGTFRMRRRPESDEQRQRRFLANVVNSRTGSRSVIWDPEGDIARAARVRRGKEHVKGLLPRSAMRAGHPR